MKRDYFFVHFAFRPCSRNWKNIFFFKKRRVCKRDPVLCLDSSLIAIALRADVVFIRDAATFQSSSKESISVVNGLRIEMENDSE